MKMALLISLSLLAAVGCSNNSSTPQTKAAGGNTPEAQSQDPQEIINKVNDITSCGGPSGRITLMGAFADQGIKSESFLTVQQYEGRGWRPECKKLTSPAIERVAQIDKDTKALLKSLKENKTYIIVGCDQDTIPSNILEGLTEAHPNHDKKTATTTVSANLVVLCGHKKDDSLNTKFVLITAHTLWVAGFGHTHQADVGAFSMTATNFAFSGSFGITSKGADGASTVLPGPGVTLAAEKFITAPVGSYVRTEGANYVKEEKK